MALATDLIGLSWPPLLSDEMACGGAGPLTITAAGTTFAASTKIKSNQFVVTSNSADGTAVGLPVIGSDSGALLGDEFTINNSGSSSLFIFASTSVLISGQGSLSSKQFLQTHQTAILYPVTPTLATVTANWVMVAGD